MDNLDRRTRQLLLRDALQLTERQALGLINLGGFASKKALEAVFKDAIGFDIELLDVEHFESRGCCPDARCERGHTLMHRYWLRLGAKSSYPRDVGVGVTCLSHLKGVSLAERRAIVAIGTWVTDRGYNAIARIFGRAKDDELRIAEAAHREPDRNTGERVYNDWRASDRYQTLMTAADFVSKNIEAAATQRKYGRASLIASLAVVAQCEEYELPVPPVHEQRVLCARRRLGRRRAPKVSRGQPCAHPIIAAGQFGGAQMAGT